MAEIGPGELVGEVSIRHERPRSATVSSIEAAQLPCIGGEDLARLLGELPTLRHAIEVAVAAHGGSGERS